LCHEDQINLADLAFQIISEYIQIQSDEIILKIDILYKHVSLFNERICLMARSLWFKSCNNLNPNKIRKNWKHMYTHHTVYTTQQIVKAFYVVFVIKPQIKSNVVKIFIVSVSYSGYTTDANTKRHRYHALLQCIYLVDKTFLVIHARVKYCNILTQEP